MAKPTPPLEGGPIEPLPLAEAGTPAPADQRLHEHDQERRSTPQDGRGLTTVLEAGRRGGRRVKELYGSAFYRQIGTRGGGKLKEQRGSDYSRQIGKQGAAAVKAKLGTDHYQAIGKQGGTTLAQQRGSDYFRRIGHLGGSAPRRSNHAREERLRAAFEQLAREDPPATPPKMAALTGFPLSSVHTLLNRTAWWGPAERHAARAAHHQHLAILAAQRGYPGVQAMRQQPSTPGRRLTAEEVARIRQRLVQGDPPSRIAADLGIHKNTVYSLRRGRTLRIETPAADESRDEERQPVRIVFGEAAPTAQVFLGWALWRALGSPPCLHLSRQGKWHALVLEGASAEQGYLVEQGPHLPSIRVERQVVQSFGLSAGAYAWKRVPHQAQVRLSDSPRDQSATLITLPEACALLQISRQRLSQLVAAGHLRAWFDAERNQLMVSRAAVLECREERTRTTTPQP